MLLGSTQELKAERENLENVTPVGNVRDANGKGQGLAYASTSL